MTTKSDDEWKPEYVSPPKVYPNGRTYFNWDDEKLQQWKNDAIKMQEVHVKDNGRTEWFKYQTEDADRIELRILIVVYGIRMPNDSSKGNPSCEMDVYTDEEKEHAKQLKKVIVKHADANNDIYMNVIYISTATQVANDENFYASEDPLFVVKNGRKFIDKTGRTYSSFQDYKENNKLPKAAMLMPKDGTYTPAQTIDSRVPLELGESPSTGLLERIKVVTNTVVMVSGMVFSMTGVVTYFAPTLFSQTALSVIQGGSFFLMGHSIVAAVGGIMDKTAHDESISSEVFLLISSALSTYSGILRTRVITYAGEGKPYAEVLDCIDKAHKAMYTVANFFAIVSTSPTLCYWFCDLMTKRERTSLDYYQLSMGLFMFVNVVTKPVTIQDVFESEQMQHLNQIKARLGSGDAKSEMSKILETHSASDKKSYMIRNLYQIENTTEFFELVRKTGSAVTCTADGLSVNDKISISPQAYNDIGKGVFLEKMEQVKTYKSSALHESFMNEFGKSIPLEQREAFEGGFDEIKKMPVEQQKDAMKNLIRKFKGDASLTDTAFNDFWEKAGKAYEREMDKQIKKIVNNLQQGSTEAGKKEDFDKLKTLATKEINGTLDPGEGEQLKQQLEKCTRHRKEYFFQTSADHSNDINYDRTMDELEKRFAGGKNLEEWKMFNRELQDPHQQNRKSDMEYDNQADVNKHMKQAENFREFRKKTDSFLSPKDQGQSGTNRQQQTGQELKNEYLQKCQNDFNEVESSGDPISMADAKQKLELANDINKYLKSEVLDQNRAFKSEIRTFTNAQNERLCYNIDRERVKSSLQHMYEQPNIEDITINNKKIFANLTISEYDRLNRVFNDYGSHAKDLMAAATKVARDSDFVGEVTSAHDMASITEALNILAKKPPDGMSTEVYLNKLISDEGGYYEAFRNAFNERVNAVNELDPAIRSQWSSPLTMAYHWWKHERDFVSDRALTADEYFVDYANNLFKTENTTGIGYSQAGNIKRTYATGFGPRIHVGFTNGDSETRASHFVKPDTR